MYFLGSTDHVQASSHLVWTLSLPSFSLKVIYKKQDLKNCLNEYISTITDKQSE